MKCVHMTTMILHRCGIPVVIMGETGCGKTRLIKFMCDLAAQGTGMRNMLIMKARYVHPYMYMYSEGTSQIIALHVQQKVIVFEFYYIIQKQ